MHKLLLFIGIIPIFSLLAISDNNIKIDYERPDNFVNVKQFIPEIQIDLRYYTHHSSFYDAKSTTTCTGST